MIKARHIAASLLIGVAALVGGCAERPASVPTSANLMTEGNGMQVTFRATQTGRVYVADWNNNQLLYQGEVKEGDMVEVVPRQDRITLAGRSVSEQALDDGHQYKIFFEPTSTERVIRYKETVVEEKPRPTNER